MTVTPAFLSDESICARQPDRVRLLEVHRDDLLHLQLVDHELGVGRPLLIVTGDVTEERRRPDQRIAGRPIREVGVRRRRRHLGEAGLEERLRGRTGVTRGGRSENRDHALVGDVLLRQRERRRRAGLDRRVTEHELDLQTVLRCERLDGELRPARLLLPEESGTAGQRRDERERDRALAVERRLTRRRNLLAALRGCRHHRSGENGKGEAHSLLHLDVLLGPSGPC